MICCIASTTCPFASILCHLGGATTRFAIRRPAFLTPENATLITKWKVSWARDDDKATKKQGQLNVNFKFSSSLRSSASTDSVTVRFHRWIGITSCGCTRCRMLQNLFVLVHPSIRPSSIRSYTLLCVSPGSQRRGFPTRMFRKHAASRTHD